MMLRSDGLFRHHRQLTARLAGRLGQGEAEDLASEAVARSLARPAPDGQQAPWLETIFRNLLADRGRRWVRRQAATAPGTIVAERVATPEELVLRAERVQAVVEALPAIPDELREAVEARFFGDLDYDQMAAGRGITPTTARTRVHRGLARLRRALAGLRSLLPAGSGGHALAPVVVAAAALLVVAPQLTAPPLASGGTSRASATSTPVRDRAVRRPVAENDVRPAPSAARASANIRRARPVAPAPAEDAPTAVRHMDFDEDEVEGELQRPGIQLVDGDPRQRRVGSLIEIPRSFEPSMTKMIEDL